jgi:hypothetical protein
MIAIETGRDEALLDGDPSVTNVQRHFLMLSSETCVARSSIVDPNLTADPYSTVFP